MKKTLLTLLSYILVAALAVTIALGVEAYLDQPQLSGSNKLQQLEELILEKFIGDADRIAMEDAAAEAMLGALGDRWSYYISAEDFTAYMEQMNNAYVGIGVTIQVVEQGGFEIIQIAAGGSAEEAGFQLGDVIVAVDGQSVRDVEVSQCRNLVRGKEGTYVQITVERAGEEITFSVERRTVQTPVATGEMLENHVGLVTIVNFDARCYAETKAAIESLLDQGATAIIFDLRYNPGGYKSELVKLLDYVLPEGVLFRSEDYLGNISVDKSDASCLDIPMAVLVNANTYSAAEFFAAALREYEVAVVVGEKTVGKGYFQNTYYLPDGSAVALSTGRYKTPMGVSLEGVGITPDIQVEVDEETAYYIYAGVLDPVEDPQILAALDALKQQ